jgi:hypothetical protein
VDRNSALALHLSVPSVGVAAAALIPRIDQLASCHGRLAADNRRTGPLIVGYGVVEHRAQLGLARNGPGEQGATCDRDRPAREWRTDLLPGGAILSRRARGLVLKIRELRAFQVKIGALRENASRIETAPASRASVAANCAQ